MNSYPPIKSTTGDFFFDVSKGAVPGHTPVLVRGRNLAVSAGTVQDLWIPGGSMVYPTAGEQWELVSTDAADNIAGGTGAQLVIVNYLDEDYIMQGEVVALTGTTPVSMVATNSFRPRNVVVIGVGSGGSNAGTITLRVQGGGNPRDGMAIGDNISMSSHYTVPAGKTALLVSLVEEVSKGEDVTLTHQGTIGPTGIFLAFAKSSIYQNVNHVTFKVFPALIEKSDAKVTATSTNLEVSPFIATEYIEVDN